MTHHLVTTATPIRTAGRPRGQALTTTVPIERVRRVVEQAGANTLSVTVELDPDTAIAITEGEYLERPDPDSADDDMKGLARGITRTTATSYELLVGPDTPDADTELVRLAAFSRALRAALGL